MTQNQLNFQSQNLVVDYITFKFQDLSSSRKIDIANYLFEKGFNSYQQSGKLFKPNKECISVNNQNTLEVLFVINVPHWNCTILQFSGLNAKNFYSLIKNESVS